MLTWIYVAFWCLLWLDAHAWFRLSYLTSALGFATAIPVCYFWIRRHRNSSLIVRRAVLSVSYLPLWQLVVQLPLLNYSYSLAATLTQAGTAGAFFLGLSWAVWWIDRETKRIPDPKAKKIVWDPRQLVAWYFGNKNNKLRQSLFTLATYTIMFGLMAFMLTRLSGCSIYESPLGGGEEKQLKQVVKIQKSSIRSTSSIPTPVSFSIRLPLTTSNSRSSKSPSTSTKSARAKATARASPLAPRAAKCASFA